MTALRNVLPVKTQVDFNGKNLIQKHAQNRKVVVMASTVRLTILIPVGANTVLALLLNRAVTVVSVTSRDSTPVSNIVRAAEIQMEFNGNLEIHAPTGRQVAGSLKGTLKVVGGTSSSLALFCNTQLQFCPVRIEIKGVIYIESFAQVFAG